MYICIHTYLLCQPDKNRYNFDSFILDGYYCVSCCHFLFESIREKRSVPLNKQALYVFKIHEACQLKISGKGGRKEVGGGRGSGKGGGKTIKH